MKRFLGVLCALLLVFSLAAIVLPSPVLALPSEVWVDDDNCPGPGSGTQLDPFCRIQDGIDAVASPGTVHVASGNYSEKITLKDGVIVQGAGANVTVIDGSTARAGLPAYHVVVGANNTTLDGFSITGGNASGTFNNELGGGMFNDNTSPTLANLTFYNNSASGGGGMANKDSSPTLTNCVFFDNSAGWGGGMYNAWSSPTVTDCTFYSNSAINGAGGMYNHDYSSSTVTNCLFHRNTSTMGWGGGMQNHKSSPMITNCTLSNNSGGGMLDWDSSPTVTNCIFWNNGYEISNDATSTPSVNYSDIKGGYSGATNIDDNPLFVDPPGDDYHLQSGSPCIDKGTNAGAPTEDIEGNPRPIDGDGIAGAITDMGAYEYVPPPPTDADLGIAKTDSPDPVLVGENLTYVVTVTNSGPADATSVNVTDTLPPGVTPQSVTPSIGSANETALGIITWNIGNLSKNASANLSILVTAPSVSGNITNTANVSGNEPDPNPSNNTVTENTTVNVPSPPASFTISIRAYIDGRSVLILTGNTVQWHHLDWAAPGRLGFVNLPTIINGVDWYPQWADVPDAENRWCDCDSSTYEHLAPPLPESDMEVELRVIQARYLISIAQYPSAGNDYEIIVEFNDNPPGGADWYECELDVTVSPPPPPVEVGGAVYTVDKLAVLAPWIALAAAIIAGATIVVRRRRVQS